MIVTKERRRKEGITIKTFYGGSIDNDALIVALRQVANNDYTFVPSAVPFIYVNTPEGPFSIEMFTPPKLSDEWGTSSPRIRIFYEGLRRGWNYRYHCILNSFEQLIRQG